MRLKEFSIVDIDLNNISDEDILRIAISAEQSAINLYNRLARVAVDPDLKTVLKDIAVEEKVHIGEFETMLIREDPEELLSINKGFEEISELLEITEDIQIGNIILEKGDRIKVLESLEDKLLQDLRSEYPSGILRNMMDKEEISAVQSLINKGLAVQGVSDDRQKTVIYFATEGL